MTDARPQEPDDEWTEERLASYLIPPKHLGVEEGPPKRLDDVEFLKAEVERLQRRTYPDQGHGYANEVERQRYVIENLQRIARQRGVTIEEYDQLSTRLSDLLTRTANALKGEPDELAMHDWSDLPEVAADLKSQVTSMWTLLSQARALHRPDSRQPGQCQEDGLTWPCATSLALRKSPSTANGAPGDD